MAEKFPGIAASISSLFDTLTGPQQSLTLYHLLLTTKSRPTHQTLLAKVLKCHSQEPEFSLPGSNGGSDEDIGLFLDYIDKMVSRKLESHRQAQVEAARPRVVPEPLNSYTANHFSAHDVLVGSDAPTMPVQSGRKRKAKSSPERTQTKKLAVEPDQEDSEEEPSDAQSNQINSVVYPAHALPARYKQNNTQTNKASKESQNKKAACLVKGSPRKEQVVNTCFQGQVSMCVDDSQDLDNSLVVSGRGGKSARGRPARVEAKAATGSSVRKAEKKHDLSVLPAARGNIMATEPETTANTSTPTKRKSMLFDNANCIIPGIANMRNAQEEEETKPSVKPSTSQKSSDRRKSRRY